MSLGKSVRRKASHAAWYSRCCSRRFAHATAAAAPAPAAAPPSACCCCCLRLRRALADTEPDAAAALTRPACTQQTDVHTPTADTCWSHAPLREICGVRVAGTEPDAAAALTRPACTAHCRNTETSHIEHMRQSVNHPGCALVTRCVPLPHG
jgi:hypothetical protein